MSAKGACILGCRGPELGADERAFFRAADPWGFILFARNIETPEQVEKLTTSLREAVGRNAPIFVDQEGGRVARLTKPHWREWLPPLDQAKRAGDQAARSFWLRYRLIAHELHSVGIDGNCAPVADIADGGTHTFLKNRCLGQNAQQVADASLSTAEAMLAGGVLPVIKHIPGHGRGMMDSHHELPRVDASRSELLSSDFVPFKALNELPMAMTAHIVYNALDLYAPATLSRAAIRAIRSDIGFDGLLMTDDISMKALSGSLAARASGALAAGCDVILHCNGEMDEMEEVVTAACRMTPAAQTRADAALAQRNAPEPIDISALEAELASLLAGSGNV